MKNIYSFIGVAISMLAFSLAAKAQCPYTTPTVNVVNGVICNGQPAILSVPNVYDSYQWYWGTVPVPVAATDYSYWAVTQGSYTLQVVLNGCTATTAPVYVSAPLVQPLNFPDTLYSCTNELLITVDNQLYNTFLWNTGETTNTKLVTQSGFYGVGAGITALSCGVADTFWVELNMPSPSVNITEIGTNPFCVDSFLILESDNATNNVWSTGETTQSITVTTDGTYSVTVDNYYGCTATASVQASTIVCAPSSQLSPAFCPNFSLVRTSGISCVSVPGATQYEWRFTNTSGVYATKISLYNYIVLHSVSPQISWGEMYSVQVRPYVNGQWGVFGVFCQIGLIQEPTPATIPLTQLRSEDCGKLTYRLNFDNRIVANLVAASIQYEFEFSNPMSGSVVATKLSPFNNIYLNTVSPALAVPAQYNVRVRVRLGGSTVWGNYGNTCLIGITGLNRENPNDLEPSYVLDEVGNVIGSEVFKYNISTRPNPFNATAQIIVESKNNTVVELYINDLTGRLIDQLKVETNTLYTVGDNLPNGIYIIRGITSQGSTFSSKVIKTE